VVFVPSSLERPRTDLMRSLSRPTAVSDDLQLIREPPRLQPDCAKELNRLQPRITSNIQGQAEAWGEQLGFLLPRRTGLNPSEKRMLPHPVIQQLLARVREGVSTAASDPTQLDP
jgi:hypothetical protein